MRVLRKGERRNVRRSAKEDGGGKRRYTTERNYFVTAEQTCRGLVAASARASSAMRMNVANDGDGARLVVRRGRAVAKQQQ